MSQKTMTSCERVTRMFERQDQDRVPRHDSYWGETLARWRDEGFQGHDYEALNLLESDFANIGGSWPSPFPGRQVLVEEDELTKVVIDDWGASTRLWKHKSGTPEHLGFGCNNREEWERTFKVAYEQYAWGFDGPSTRKGYADARAAGKWCFLTGLESFEATRRLMGDETTWIALVEDPEWVMEVSRVYTDVVLQGLDAIMATGVEPDGLWVYGDMAFNHGPVCSPKMYRETLWHDHKRLADWAHTHGMKFIFHTDGNVRPMLDFYEEAGFDCLQPLESKAGMDVRALCPERGERMAFFGNIDVMTMGTNDRDAIDEEMRTKFAAGMAGKCYAYHSDHSVPPTVSFETYKWIVDRVNTYGNYE